ncbi:MAG TPA: FAD-dependent oxidoreductase, partial [Ilumatobacteraceae bacterium]|nr:FAD-dependent oxidoreductase [Ilumatobacteraceae bacterium]
MSQPEGDGATHYDLILIGTGSGNSIIGPEMDAMRIAIVERDLFGGTCLNRGCIPSKMFVVAAEAARTAADSRRLGIYSHFDRADWPAIVERVFGRIDPIAEGGRVYRHSLDNVTVYEGDGRFSGERQVEVRGNDGQVSTITGDQVVIATGARAHLPEIAGLDEVAFHTSDTIMRLPALPGHLIVVGGGFIACEMADVFAAFGSKVTVIQRSDLLLRSEDHDIAQRFTELASERFDLRLNTTISRVESDHGVIRAITEHGEVLGDTLLIATGRQP